MRARAAPRCRRRAARARLCRSRLPRVSRQPSAAGPAGCRRRERCPADRPAISAPGEAARAIAGRPRSPAPRSSLRSRRVEVRRWWIPSLFPRRVSGSLAAIRETAPVRAHKTARPAGSSGLTLGGASGKVGGRAGSGTGRSPAGPRSYRSLCGMVCAAASRNPRRLLWLTQALIAPARRSACRFRDLLLVRRWSNLAEGVAPLKPLTPVNIGRIPPGR